MRHDRGFTLLEVMIAAALAIGAIAMVMGVFITQQRSLQRVDTTRIAMESQRDALYVLEESIRRAGYGIEPRYAFDFDWYQCPSKPCRDKIDGPDELVFYARDPSFYVNADAGTYSGHAWTVVANQVSNTAIQMTGGATPASLTNGRIVELVCADPTKHSMATVSSVSGGGADGGSNITLTLDTTTTGPYNERNFGDACFQNASTAVYLVDRFRYHLASYPSPTLTGVNDSYLMLDTGLYYSNVLDDVPIARNVEDFQVSYLLNMSSSIAAPDVAQPDASVGNWALGDSRGNVEEPKIDAGLPAMDALSTDTNRFTINPANIRGVKVEMVLRGDIPNTTLNDIQNPTGDAIPLLGNRSSADAGTGAFRRYSVSTSVGVRNTDARTVYTY